MVDVIEFVIVLLIVEFQYGSVIFGIFFFNVFLNLKEGGQIDVKMLKNNFIE